MPTLPLTRLERIASALLLLGALCIEGPTWLLASTSLSALGLLAVAGLRE